MQMEREKSYHDGHQSGNILAPVKRKPPCQRTITGRFPETAVFDVRTVHFIAWSSTVL